jgi:hypothetical protein
LHTHALARPGDFYASLDPVFDLEPFDSLEVLDVVRDNDGGEAARMRRDHQVVRTDHRPLLLEQSVLPYVQPQALTGKDMLAALGECESRGVRGGAIYDWLHLAAARKAGAEVFFTLDLRDFQSLARRGDPRIEVP